MRGRSQHGLSKHPLHRVWVNMRFRCLNGSDKNYSNYGGRGIFIAEVWLEDFVSFYVWALEHGYEQGLQIDRIDNDGPYSPDNCRWVTPKQNSNNTRVVHLLTAFGETKCLADWAKDHRCAITDVAIMKRLTRGYPPEIAITAPRHDRKGRNTWV